MKSKSQQRLSFACLIGLLLLGGSCAASRSTDPGAPAARSDIPGYPVSITDTDDKRRERAIAAWRRIASISSGGQAVDPILHPVTSTLRSLPVPAPMLKLPLVGDPDRATMTAEETREALRRFLASAVDLLGAETIQLSLIDVAERGDLRTARYEQRPFLYPLRNNYGLVEIEFTSDRRITQLSSRAIPIDEQLRRTVNRLAPRLRADEIATKLVNRTITLIGDGGGVQTLAVTAADQIRPQELVIFPRISPVDTATLELRLAWEVGVKAEGASEERLVYVDALTGEILTAPAPNQLSRRRLKPRVAT